MAAFHKRSLIRTKSGNMTKAGLLKGHVQSHRCGLVTLEHRSSGVYLVTMKTLWGDEMHMTKRLQTAREKYREFAELVDRTVPVVSPVVSLAPQRVTI